MMGIDSNVADKQNRVHRQRGGAPKHREKRHEVAARDPKSPP